MFESMMTAITGVHAHVKDLHGDLLRDEGPRPGHGGLTTVADGPAGAMPANGGAVRPCPAAMPMRSSSGRRAPARLAGPARRQVDLAPGAAPRAARRGREHDRGGGRRRGRPVHGGDRAPRSARPWSALPSTAGAWTTASSRRAATPSSSRTHVLDCGNSGTTTRLVAGLLAGATLFAVLDGDASLRRRPMGRVAEPLRRDGRRVRGPGRRDAPAARDHRPRTALPRSPGGPPVPSAQVKSAILLAGLAADGETTRDRGRRHARPHRADAPRARHRGRARRPAATGRTPSTLRGPALPAAIDGDRPVRPVRAPRSGWWPARSTRTRRSGSTG